MADIKNTKENQILVKAGLEGNIKFKDIPTLKVILEWAKTVKVSTALRYKATMLVAKSVDTPRGRHEAFEYYMSARKLTKNPSSAISHAWECLDAFFWENETYFSTSDLWKLLEVVEPFKTICMFYLHEPILALEQISKTQDRINYRLNHTAKDAVETKVTFPTLQIKDAFYTDMTFEEMQNELARLVALMILTSDSTDDKDEKKDGEKQEILPTKKEKKKKKGK